MKKLNLKVFISFIVSLVLLIVIIAQVNWKEVQAQLQTVNYWFLLLAYLPMFGQFYSRAVRWRYFLPEERRISTRLSFDGIMLGNFINYILPLRAGEFARPFFITQHSQLKYAESFAAVVIERFFDLACVLIMFMSCTVLFKNFPEWVSLGAISLSIIAAGIFLYILAAIFFTDWIEKLTKVIFSYLPKKLSLGLSKFITGLFNGAHSLKSRKAILNIFLQTILVWFWTVAQYWIALYMFDGQFEIKQALLITVIIALAVAAPSAPGFIGVIQAACVAAFLLLGLPTAQAVTYSILVHLQSFILIILYGLYLQYHYGVKIKPEIPA